MIDMSHLKDSVELLAFVAGTPDEELISETEAAPTASSVTLDTKGIPQQTKKTTQLTVEDIDEDYENTSV